MNEPLELEETSGGETRTVRRLRPAWGLGALALMFVALFAWSELRLRETRAQLSHLEATNRALAEERHRLRAAPRSTAAPLSELKGSGTSRGRLYRDEESGTAVLFVSQLPQLDATRRYELTATSPDGKRVALATFAATSAGSAQVVIAKPPARGTTIELRVSGAPASAAPLLSGTI